MGYFELITEDQAGPKEKSSYVEIKNVFGITSVPDFFLALASSSDTFSAAWGAYKEILAGGILPQQIKEIIFLAVALNRRCIYCSSTHLAVCDMIDGISSAEIDALMDDITQLTPQRIQDIVTFAIKYVESPTAITEEDFKNLDEHGISEREVTEIITMAGLAYYAINIAQAMGIEVETEISEYLAEHNLQERLKQRIYG